MFQDVDRTLERLLRDRVPLGADDAVTFATPGETFRNSLVQPFTVNIFLYDLRENHDLRSADWPLERLPDGRARKQRPKARIDLVYMVTAWGKGNDPDVLGEHKLLSRMLRTLLRYPTLPADLLQGALVGQEPPLPTLVAQPDGMRNAAEFWGAMRQPLRPGIHLVVTIALRPEALTDVPIELQPAISVALELGASGGRRYDLTVRPSLFQAFDRGTVLRRLKLSSDPVMQLQNDVFASARALRVKIATALAPGDWIMLDAGTQTEFVRVVRISATDVADEREVVVDPPLGAAYEPTPTAPVPVRRAASPDVVAVTFLTARVEAGEDELTVADRNGITPAGSPSDGALLISDAEQSEVVQMQTITATTGIAGKVTVKPKLRSGHDADRNVYRLTLEPPPSSASTAQRLVRAAAQSGAQIVLDGAVQPDTLLMVGVGATVEFCRVTSATAVTAGNPVTIDPPLRENHPKNTTVRTLTVAALVGRLLVPGSQNSEALAIVGDAAAVESARRREAALISPGDLLQLEGPPPAGFQVADVRESPGAFQSTTEELVSIGGHVTDDRGQPVVGAQVLLRAPGPLLWIEGEVGQEDARAETRLIPRPRAADVAIPIAPDLVFSHPVGRALRRVLLAETIGHLTAQSDTDSILLDAPLTSGTIIWIQGDAGQEETQAEVRRITGTVAAGVDVPIAPDLDFIHASGREVRRVLLSDPIGRLHNAATVSTIQLDVDSVAALTRGAKEPLLTASTIADGDFTFTGLPPGLYTLRVTAPGYRGADKVVEVPARTVVEYAVTVTP